ncbi:MAG: hypothetical protein K0S44_1154 [Bacteroidetes bacterium]|jgi:hypothetical protein|nr:hypothetical protein [Bacteroidota bacterium]
MKIKDINVMDAYKVADIWRARAKKIEIKYPNRKEGDRPGEIIHRLIWFAYRIIEIRSSVFDPAISHERIDPPKKSFKIYEWKPGPIQALIDSNGQVWTPIEFQDDWYTCGKYSIRIIDHTGFKIIKRGEPIPLVKKTVKEKGISPQYRERKLDPTAFDDLRYEGLD